MSDVIEITRDEYEALLAAREELADIHAFDQAMATWVPGLPAEVANRIIDGENALKAIRKWRGMTQVTLSGKSGVTQAQISDIEREEKNGSTVTLSKLARALDVSIEFLIDD